MTITAATITCRKCRVVGIVNFKRGPVYVAGGDCLDVISCRICGDWYANKPAVEKMSRAVPPVKDRALGTCHVSGCGNYISANPLQNKTGLCTTCSNKLNTWRVKGSKGLPPLVRTETGYITRAAFAALNPQEVNHVETIQEHPRLAPPAPPAPASRHQARRVPLGRRDSLEGMILFPEENAAELFLLLAVIALPTSPDIIAGWSAAERREVGEFVASLSTAIALPMPDVLVPIYDAAFAATSQKRRA